MNLKESIEYIFEAGAKSTEAQVVNHPTNPDKRLVISAAGVVELDTPRQPPSGADVCYSVADFATRLESDTELSNTVWYDDYIAICYSKDQFRLRRVSISFLPHPILKSVLNLATQKVYEQKQVVRLLRIDFGGLAEEFVLSRFRSLNWDMAKRAKQIVKHGNASLDSEVRSSVTTDEGELPEAFVINVPLFADIAYRNIAFPAKVAVDLDTDNCRIGLVLMPGTVEDIATAQRESIAGFLSNALGEKYDLICGESTLATK